MKKSKEVAAVPPIKPRPRSCSKKSDEISSSEKSEQASVKNSVFLNVKKQLISSYSMLNINKFAMKKNENIPADN